MLDVSRDIHSLADSKKRTPKYFAELRTKSRARLFTVDDRVEAAVTSATTFQKVLEAFETLDAIRGVRHGLGELAADRTRPGAQFFAELRKKPRRRGRSASATE